MLLRNLPSKVKIALFSLGNLAVHLDCRAELVDNLQASLQHPWTPRLSKSRALAKRTRTLFLCFRMSDLPFGLVFKSQTHLKPHVPQLCARILDFLPPQEDCGCLGSDQSTVPPNHDQCATCGGYVKL
eukprot:4503436-Amphidinium_carterae.1